MKKTTGTFAAILLSSACSIAALLPALTPVHTALLLPPALAVDDQCQIKVLAEKKVSIKELEKYKQVTVVLYQNWKKVTYAGVPLRVLLVDMVPDLKMESMPEWKALSRKEIVMEVKGDDGYPGLVTATEIAMDKVGDRFILATHEDGKPIEAGAHLICRTDLYHTRWVRQVVSIKVLSISSDKGSKN